ncbi:FAD-dependent monooxygenase [Nocardia sp. CDC153]|uniref:FAD-dependent monooxygenase n=1 Tax=Nocardia sp. CDC153 TaxID=3112167 RepID=UPI002DBB9FBF|nr:FAD-dependent monooxygenase [Nocardia sp. CDC153]MEC3952018.1 FAD-dependent monooxygenase [Nocardia sp. CDC153]
MSSNERLPVVIVGGGLVGLSAACFLARHGIPATVLEQRTTLSSQPRSRGVNPRTVELMRELDLEEAIRATPSSRALLDNTGIIAMQSLAGAEIGALKTRYAMDVHADLSDLTPSSWCLCHQAEMEPILAARATALGADIRFGVTVIRADSTADEVLIAARGAAGDGEFELRADYVIAADGVGSRIRQRLGIPFRGETLGSFLNIHFRAALGAQLGDRRFVMAYTFHPQRAGLMPLDNDTDWLLHVMFDPILEPAESFGPQRCVDLVRAVAGVPDLEVDVIGSRPWHSTAATAGRFRAGRIFLVGDAAHAMPPSGAFGSNTGIQDAHNLAWKIAAVYRGYADAELLDTYDAERRPNAEQTVRQAVLRSQDRPHMADQKPAPPHPDIVSDERVWFGCRQLGAVASTEIDPTACGAEAIWPDRPDGSVGTRAPHVPMVLEGMTVSTVDLLGPEFVLFSGTEGAAWDAAAADVAERSGLPLRRYRIGPERLHDSKELWHSAFGVEPSGAVLVRPDGIVAWRARSGSADPTGALTAAVERILAKV